MQPSAGAGEADIGHLAPSSARLRQDSFAQDSSLRGGGQGGANARRTVSVACEMSEIGGGSESVNGASGGAPKSLISRAVAFARAAPSHAAEERTAPDNVCARLEGTSRKNGLDTRDTATTTMNPFYLKLH